VTSVICHGTTMEGFERRHTAPRGFFRAG